MFWLLSVSWISIWNLESTCQFLQRLSLKLLIWIVLNLNYFAVQYLSRVWLCNPMDCSMPVLPVHHQLLESTQTQYIFSDHSFRKFLFRGSISSVQFSHLSCPTLWDPMDCSTPFLPVHHQFTEFTQTQVHWVGDAIQPSHLLSSPSPPAFNLSQHQGFFKWVSSSHQVAKVLEFQFNISPSNEHSGLISFRMDWSLQSKGLPRVLSNTTVQKHQFFSAQLSL